MRRPRPSYFEEGPEAQGARLNRRALLGGLALTVSAVGALGAGYGAYAAGLFASPPEIDKATGCRLDVKSEHTSIVLIDNTDPLTGTLADRTLARLEATASAMPDYGRLIVAVLKPDDPTAPDIVFRHCAPRAPARTSALEGGAIYVRREFNEEFLQPLLGSVQALLKGTGHAKRSPILATIAGLTQRPDFDGSVPDRRLVIISDLVDYDERKGGYSQAQKGDLKASYRRSALAASLQPDLTKVHVVIDYLQRPLYAPFQNAAHRTFWTEWLKEAGAADVSFLNIRDVATAPADQAGANSRSAPPRRKS